MTAHTQSEKETALSIVTKRDRNYSTGPTMKEMTDTNLLLLGLPEIRHRCTNGHEWDGQPGEGWITAPWDPGIKLCQQCWWERLKEICGQSGEADDD